MEQIHSIRNGLPSVFVWAHVVDVKKWTYHMLEFDSFAH